ncbi:hypothetical protein BG004_002565 [Podila humilis]|nr:hypothetical protein BG004_002565 [Podila humilis]
MSRRVEQEWFLSTQVQSSLESIQKALMACQDASRLQDDTMGALTLAISSAKIRHFVKLFHRQRSMDTRRIFSSDTFYIATGLRALIEMIVKLPKLPVVRAAIHAQAPTTSATPSVLSVPVASTTQKSGSTTGSSAGSSRTSIDNVEISTEPSKFNAASASKHSKPLQDTVQTPPQPLTPSSEVAPVITTSAATPPTVVAPIGSQVNPHQLAHRAPGHLTQPYLLEQIKDVQNNICQALLRLEDYWRALNAKSDESLPKDIKESTRPLKTLLELLQRHLQASIDAMAQPNKEKLYPFRVCDPKIFSPALSEDFVIEFYIKDSQLVCAAYALQLTGGSSSGNNGGHTASSLSTFLHQSTPPSQAPAPFSTLTSESGTGTASRSRSSSVDVHHFSAGAHVHFPQQPTQAAHGQVPSTLLSAAHAVTSTDQHHQQHPKPKGGAITPRPSSPVAQHSHHQYQPSLPNQATTLEDKMVQVENSKLSEISAKLADAEGLCRRLLHFLEFQKLSQARGEAGITVVHRSSGLDSRPGRALGLGQRTGLRPTGRGQRIVAGRGGAGGSTRTSFSGHNATGLGRGIHTASGLARAMQETGGGVTDDFLFAPEKFVAGRGGRSTPVSGITAGRTRHGGAVLRGAGAAARHQPQQHYNTRVSNHKSLALGTRPIRHQGAQGKVQQHQQHQQQHQGYRGAKAVTGNTGAQKKSARVATQAQNDTGKKNAQKEKKQKVDPSSLDSELQEYMMKNDQTAASALDMDLDSYMAEKPAETTW